MLESAWLLMGGLGTLWMLFSLISMTIFHPSSGGSTIQFFTAVLAFICYGVFTYGSLDVTVVGDSVTYSFTMPTISLAGLVLTVASLFLVLSEPIDALSQWKRPDPEEL